MKTAILAIALMLSGSQSFAASCLTLDGVTINDGDTAVLYYAHMPAMDMGPNYKCAEVGRVRQCVNGQFSQNEPVCKDSDSGGCADFWIDQLADKYFVYGACFE